FYFDPNLRSTDIKRQLDGGAEPLREGNGLRLYVYTYSFTGTNKSDIRSTFPNEPRKSHILIFLLRNLPRRNHTFTPLSSRVPRCWSTMIPNQDASSSDKDSTAEPELRPSKRLRTACDRCKGRKQRVRILFHNSERRPSDGGGGANKSVLL